MTGPRRAPAPPALWEFHVSRAARERCAFDETLFATNGRVVLASPAAARRFALRLTQARGGRPAASPGDLFAMGLLHEVLHLAIARYREQADPRAWPDALGWFESRLGRGALDGALLAFAEDFPVVAVHRGHLSAAAWLEGETSGVSHRAVALEEMLLLWLANANPACGEYAELFDESPLRARSAYGQVVGAMREYFETRPRFGPQRANLVDFLRAPALAAPHSLAEQLAWIRTHWAWLLGDFLARLLVALDVLAEEARYWSQHGWRVGPGGLGGESGDAAVLRFGGQDDEYEAFSPDQDWMPTCVLIAKSTHVWLHQLEVAYRRDVKRLDQIPDEELDRLRELGVNAIWFIGLWERSRASQRIKQLCGNPEAAASAYSLHDYAIAHDLGGEAAWRALRDRAAARGLRLASDMVPNHMGLDSRWVIEHPEWFLQLGEPPYPAYTFDGPDLSDDARVGLWVEDHYYDRSDAAVVFKRLDRGTGEVRYLYHGNDGTSFPWNDTAQLDYLRADVREQVIRTILDVARRFPIIRFDAAMTLAKRHIQRLWFPEPGSGGGIPSRAGHGLTRADFDQLMPQEFWREVVDRVAREAPGTLLLAEAFWLMEGYFVRTLGMHRVYNSAFMNMLRDEKNANYRSVIKNTLEFDPDVLRRYVNFVNNPDERTAVDQFGRGEKYFGTCTLLATLPGLPMFGHGQIEGFEEKYGMEYRRAYRDEVVDEGLVAEHRRRIAPLLHRRWLFAHAHEFLLYDCWSDAGHVNEDVYAYSNRAGGESALVVFHNRFAEARGWIRTSAAYADKGAGRALRQRSLAEGLGLPADDSLVRCRDLVSDREFLFRAGDVAERGLRLELGGYQSLVLLDWRVVHEDGRPWRRLADELAGSSVARLDEALREVELRPVHEALRELLAPSAVPERLERAAGQMLAGARHAAGGAWRGEPAALVARLLARFAAADALPALAERGRERWPAEVAAVLPAGESASDAVRMGVRAWAAVEALGALRDPAAPETGALELFDVLRLRGPIAASIRGCGVSEEDGWRAAARARAAFAHARSAPAALAADADVRWLLGANEHDGVTWFNAESLVQFAWWRALPELLALAATPDATALRALRTRLARERAAAAASGWRLDAWAATGASAPKRRAGRAKPAAERVAPAPRAAAKRAAAAGPKPASRAKSAARRPAPNGPAGGTRKRAERPQPAGGARKRSTRTR
jgi:glycosidase